VVQGLLTADAQPTASVDLTARLLRLEWSGSSEPKPHPLTLALMLKYPVSTKEYPMTKERRYDLQGKLKNVFRDKFRKRDPWWC